MKAGLAAVVLAALLPWFTVQFQLWGWPGVQAPVLGLAVLAVLRLLLVLPSDPVRPRFEAVLVLALGVAALPFQSASAAALLVVAAACIARAEPGGRHLGAILVGMALVMSADPVWRNLFSDAFLAGEALVAAFLVGFLWGPADATGNLLRLADGRTILLLRECSMTQLLGSAMLVGLSSGAMLGRYRVRLLGSLVLTVAGIAILNNLRLVGMAHSEAAYRWLHEGPGSDLYSVGCIALAVAVFAGPRRA